MAPGTEFARDFCAGIGPLQLGVVLVFNIFQQKIVYCCLLSYKFDNLTRHRLFDTYDMICKIYVLSFMNIRSL